MRLRRVSLEFPGKIFILRKNFASGRFLKTETVTSAVITIKIPDCLVIRFAERMPAEMLWCLIS